MVKIQRSTDASTRSWKRWLPAGVMLGLICVVFPRFWDDHSLEASPLNKIATDKMPNGGDRIKEKEAISAPKSAVDLAAGNSIKQCPYTQFSDLTPDELNPVKSSRHMVDPPAGGPLHLVCCQTTKGPLNFVVHEKWAPLGAQRVLEMIKTGYFNAGVPLMRCLRNFLCQFGLNNDPDLSKKFRKSFEDDPNWLPEGKDNRQNSDGVVRFAHGYLAYAGGGKHSRTNQLIVSLKPVQGLAGGSPWEVPWGELVGEHSFDTLSKFYTGYAEKGPPQGKLSNRGMTDEMKQEFPDLDYVNACAIIDERIEA